MKLKVWILTVSVFIVDQLSKFIVSSRFDPNESLTVIKNIFHITLVHNTGAAFGIFKNQAAFFTVVSVLAVFFIIAYMRKSGGTFALRDTGFAFILGGAFGNLADRARFGYVIDFLDFRIWPVFNVADSAITLGAVLVGITLVCTQSCSK